MKHFLIIFSLIYISNSIYAQMNVDTLVSPEQLVKEVLLGGNNVKVGNIQYHGDSAARGYFEVETSKLFVINKGLVLSTGLASSATGPNSTSHKSELLFTKGDSDLEMLCNEITHDAAVLEFDFVPTSNKISFQYIFASEEYLEFAGSKFNDVFGFFISGPAIKGQKNMAIMPNSDEIVAINSINQFKNTDYFINNNAWRLNGKIKSDVSLGMLDKDLLKTTEFDGMTIVLTAETNVIPFKKYHFKIAIADVNDRKYNSAVFLKGGSFKIVEDKTAPAEFLVNIDVDKERIDLDAILNAPTFHKNEFTPKGTSGELTLPIKKNIAKKNTSKKEIIFSEPNTRKKESKSVKNKLIGEEKIPENKVAEKPMLDEYTKMSIITQEKSIYFSTDSYQLSTEMKGYLNDLIQKIRGLNNASIGLLGHTDGIGNSDYNLLLSARRTQAVKAYLLKNGINSNQIKTEHFGELKPIESNSSSKGRQKNRRVEIRLTK